MNFNQFWTKRNTSGTWSQKTEEARHLLTWDTAQTELRNAMKNHLNKVEAVLHQHKAVDGLDQLKKARELCP